MMNMLIIAMSTIGSTIIVHIYYRGQYEVPWIFRKIFLNYLAKAFFMNKTVGKSEKNLTAVKSELYIERTKCYAKIHAFDSEKSFKMKRIERKTPNEITVNNQLSLSLNLIKNDTKEIRDYLISTQKKLARIDFKLKHSREWKEVAYIFDRFLFFLYFFCVAISAGILLL